MENHFHIGITKCGESLKELIIALKRLYHFLYVRCRAKRIDRLTDKTVSDKLHTLADKIEALESYKDKHCDPNKKWRIDTYYPKRVYNKIKNDLKKEALLVLYGY